MSRSDTEHWTIPDHPHCLLLWSQTLFWSEEISSSQSKTKKPFLEIIYSRSALKTQYRCHYTQLPPITQDSVSTLSWHILLPQNMPFLPFTVILQNNKLVGAKDAWYFMQFELNQEKTVMSMDSDTVKGRGDPKQSDL